MSTYGGTPRDVWYLTSELVKLKHQVYLLSHPKTICPFAKVIQYQPDQPIDDQIPDEIDIAHFHSPLEEPITKPYIVTIHGNTAPGTTLDINTVFISRNHAERHGSTCYVYNGMDWDDYGLPELDNKRDYFHFLGRAAWRVKNVKGAIRIVQKSGETIKIIGGKRINFSMGFRITLARRAEFCGMMGGEEKLEIINGSRGLIFPVTWHEPMGLAIIESLYFGCPVFGTPYGSLPELVNNMVGFLSSSSDELAAALKDADSYSRLLCHEYARDNFNAKKMATEYVYLYEKVLNGHACNSKPPLNMAKRSHKDLPFH